MEPCVAAPGEAKPACAGLNLPSLANEIACQTRIVGRPLAALRGTAKTWRLIDVPANLAAHGDDDLPVTVHGKLNGLAHLLEEE